MADSPVAPPGGAANDSRRNLLKSLALSPFAMASPGASGATLSPLPWSEALTDYGRARAHYDAFLAHVLSPACRRAEQAIAAGGDRRSSMAAHGIFPLEEHGNDLALARWAALRALILTPAPDAPSLLMKMRFAYEDIFRHQDQDALFAALLRDAEQWL
ncbi:hypothetical protein SAMN05428974_0598 [Sphingopyxis sp. YR583]|uniref:hypothetical protein n=1 Tax=Sphingopyxis sp. YR583 TaxID=1881047 RepID=UPI0008A7F051|nr:hypothetical protein [Sphingopyxis sp. YR583]SEH12921.1 hypothetical protein SAMN05428974_0598 [Sphingopyxis sp. YR583]